VRPEDSPAVGDRHSARTGFRVFPLSSVARTVPWVRTAQPRPVRA